MTNIILILAILKIAMLWRSTVWYKVIYGNDEEEWEEGFDSEYRAKKRFKELIKEYEFVYFQDYQGTLLIAQDLTTSGDIQMYTSVQE